MPCIGYAKSVPDEGSIAAEAPLTRLRFVKAPAPTREKGQFSVHDEQSGPALNTLS